MKKFFEKIEKRYTLEDFTGYLGEILADETSEEALKFIESLYNFAREELCATKKEA